MMKSNTKRTTKIERPVLKSLFSSNFVTLNHDLTVGAALSMVRTKAKRGDIFYLYVVNETQQLVGIVSIRHLLLSADLEPITNVLSRKVDYLSEGVTRAEAAQRFSDCRFLSLPVIGNDGKIIGVLHAHDIAGHFSQSHDKLFEDRTRSQLFELLGIEAENRSVSVIQSARSRFPWLVINMLGGSLSALLIHFFGPKIPHAVAFLAFVPILLIICESIGMQTASVVITKLRHSRRRAAKIGRRELSIASCLGLASGLTVGAVIALSTGQFDVALAVGVGIFMATVLVSTVAFAVPVLTRKFGIDPSISSGPVVLAIADCSALFIYLLLAYFFSGLI